MTAVDTLTGLAEKAERHLQLVTAPALLEAARELLNETEITRHHRQLADAAGELVDAPAVVEKAKQILAEEKVKAAAARDQYEQVLLEAEWELDARFLSEGNKTYLVTHHDHEVAGGLLLEDREPAVWEARKAMTADERDRWKRHHATKTGPVTQARQRVDAADLAVTHAALRVGAEEDRWQALRAIAEVRCTAADLAVAHLSTLARCLGSTPTKETSR